MYLADRIQAVAYPNEQFVCAGLEVWALRAGWKRVSKLWLAPGVGADAGETSVDFLS